MKDLIKKWWFWVIIVVIIALLASIIINQIKQEEVEKTAQNIGNSATDFISEMDSAQSHLNEFSYNYKTGEVEYTPSKITLEMYNRINEGMSEKEVSQILGVGEKLQGENTYMISWGDMNMSKGYWIQITFNSSNKVISKSQIGLK